MQLKTRSLRYISSLILCCLLSINWSQAQDVVADNTAQEIPAVVKDTVKKKMKPFRLDGVAGVVGDFVILESEVDRTLEEINAQSQGSVNITRCQMMGQLLETKLATHLSLIHISEPTRPY